MGEFSWQLQNGAKRWLVVSPSPELPHQSAATLSDIKAALAERGLCVVAKVGAEPTDEELSRLFNDASGDLETLVENPIAACSNARRALFRAGQHSRDEGIARLTAQLAAEQQKRQEVERRECLDHQEIAEALGILEQLPDQAGVVAEIVRLRAELAAEKNASKSSNGSPNPPGISESSVEPDESDPLPWHSDVYGKIYDANDHYVSTAPRTSAFIVARCNAAAFLASEQSGGQISAATVADLADLLTDADVRVTFDRGRNIKNPCTFCGRPPETAHELRNIGKYPNGNTITRPVCTDCTRVADAIDASRCNAETVPCHWGNSLQLPWSRRDEGSNTIVNSSDDLVADFYSSADVDHALSRCNAPATVPRSEVEALLRELVEANSAGDCDRFARALGAAVEWLAKDEVK